MEGNSEHISITNADGKLHLPLHDFFLVLKRNNFLVSPEQLSDVNIIISQYANSIKNELELCDYISPIFAKSQEEQMLFKQLFEAHYHLPPVTKKKPIKPILDGRLLIPIILLLGLLSWTVWYLFNPVPPLLINCNDNAILVIQKSPDLDSIEVNVPIQLKALITGIEPDSIAWSSSNHGHFKNINSQALTTSESTSGIKTFTCEAFYQYENTLCSVRNTLELIIFDTNPLPKINLETSANAQLIKLSNKVFWYWYLMVGFLFLISLYLMILFVKRLNKLKNFRQNTKNKNQDSYDDLLKSFSGNEGVTDVPFLNKNFLIFPESQLRVIATQMRKRINDDITYMHIEKTITNVINNGGFFHPVMSTRTQQSEFLILIDNDQKNKQQVKLYEFLIELLKKYNVYMDIYYFDKTPLYCHHKNESINISLEKLSEQFPEHILLVFGDAYQLILPDYPAINRQALEVLNRWEYKCIITPVSFLDWGNKEKKILLPYISVLPMDRYGITILMEKLFSEDVNILSKLEKSSDAFYEVDMIDFQDIDELHDYCTSLDWANINNDNTYSNLLFQWVAALAVYPKISWELTLEIGKSILDKHDLGQELNYTTLLKLVRISWMKSAEFPDFIRLNLLKHLNTENEITAREAILHALTEIPSEDLNSTHFSYEEKETQRIINAFNLYAYDPINYAHYSDAKELFAKLNNDSLITDVLATTYLENSNLKWNTLINDKLVHDTYDKRKNITLKEFLTEPLKNPSLKETIYKYSVVMISLIFLTTLGGLISLIVMDHNNNQNAPFTEEFTENRTINIVYDENISNALITNNIILNIDNAIFRLKNESNNSQNQASVLSNQFEVFIDGEEKKVTINWNNTTVLDTVLLKQYDSYDISLLPAKKLITEFVVDSIPDELSKPYNQAGPDENNGRPESKSTKPNLDNSKNKVKSDSDKDGFIDRDGVPDKKEIKDTRDINVKQQKVQPQKQEKTQTPINSYAKVILFESGKATISKQSESALAEILNILKEYPENNFIIEGHAADGEANKNEQVLSEKRANYVKEFLVSNGISPSRLSTNGYGNSRPIASNMTSDGRAMNRRVELNLDYKK